MPRLVILAAAGCTSATSPTDLHPQGPPMIQQVRLVEVYSAGGRSDLERTVFGFGTHPQATSDDAHPVTTAKASGNRLRIIMDELLRGNDLEEIECRYPVDAESFSRVPPGATPDDIQRCAAAQDDLRSTCPGSNPRSVCLCRMDAGCPSGLDRDGNRRVTPGGESVGVLDRNQDGVADHTRLIPGSVGISCNGIDVPIDSSASFWSPSGNQLPPAAGGFDALGPAIVLVPLALPTGLECGLYFSPAVADKDDNRVCAPPDGNILDTCRPGDVSAFTFTVEPLGFAVGTPIRDPGQSRADPIEIDARAPIDSQTLANITVTEGAQARYTSFVATMTAPNRIAIRWTSGLAASTRYTITIPSTVTDTYGQGAAQPFQVAFTTGDT
ncbi:MAG TPA: Ig-like domain-containing protein [Kofleriaceae bacterium]|nr:Ig-like domain-containing protein [Kofleriaceae bacterium]